jgi:outer membrane protein OmpA-like peptidoglycan-associated protein
MKCNPWRWLWGLLPIAMWSWITVLAETQRIEQDLAERAGSALSAAGLDWARSAFVGRDGSLTGAAYDEGEPSRAIDVARSVWGVRMVEAQTEIVGKVENYAWSAAYGDNRILLAGHVPGEAMRQSILGMVKANFPSTRIVDEMKAARGVPDRDVWLGGIDFSLRQLAGLRSGEVDLSRDGLSVAGEAASPAAYKTIKGEIRSNLPKGIRLAEDKVSPPRVSPFTWKAELSPSQLVMSGHVLGDKVRERVFARAKELFAKLAVVDRMETADGAGEEWPGVALAALDLLAQLQDGSASIVDRSLVLAGRAADEATAERVRTALRRAAPSSYSVSERLTYPKPEPKPVSPFVTGISGAADKIELTGYVPSEAARANVLARIASRFPKASISDQMKVAAGAPEGWKECLEAGLGGLQQLGAATIALSDRRLELVGRTEREGLAENVAGEVKAAANRACETDVRIAYDAEPEPSLVWRAVHGGDGTLVLEGEVPDQETHAELVTTAGKAFSGARLTDNAKIVGVRPGKWPKAAGLGLRLLAKLRRGTAAISGAELTIVGEARDAAIAQSVKDQLGREIAKGYRGVDNIEVRSDAMIWAEQEAQRRAEAQRLKEQAEQQRQRDEAAAAALRRSQEEEAAAARKRAEEAERQRKAESAAIETRKRTEAEACQQRMRDVAQRGVIRFGWASATLEDESLPTLKELAAVANACPLARIEIEGHTDAEGTPERNSKLSERRAQAVVGYLTSAGVDAGRLTAVGYGATRPVASNDTPESRARNRRIEFKVVPN